MDLKGLIQACLCVQKNDTVTRAGHALKHWKVGCCPCQRPLAFILPARRDREKSAGWVLTFSFRGELEKEANISNYNYIKVHG
jgi:hypothetical protein